MKKIIMSAIMCVALMASSVAVAQDTTPKKDQPKKECCKDKTTKKKGDKKSCCKDTAKTTDKKAECCKEKAKTTEADKK